VQISNASVKNRFKSLGFCGCHMSNQTLNFSKYVSQNPQKIKQANPVKWICPY